MTVVIETESDRDERRRQSDECRGGFADRYLLPSLRRRASAVRRYEGRLGRHRSVVGAVARKPLGLPSNLGPRLGSRASCRHRHARLRPLRRSPGTDRPGRLRSVPGPPDRRVGPRSSARRRPRRRHGLGGGAVRFPIEAGGALKDIIEAPNLDVVRGLDARTNIGYAVEPAAASNSEPEVHEDYVSAYDLGRFAESARFVRHYPEQNPVLRDLLPTITTPTQIVAGRDDDLVPWSNNQYLDDLLPNSEIHPLDAGHFAWEQAAEEYGRLVVDWVSGGYRRVEAG